MYILATHIYIVKEKVSLAADGQFIPPPKRWGTSCPFRLKYTSQVSESCKDRDLSSESMVIGTSAIVETEIDGAVNMYSGIFNNPFLIWGRYRKKLFRYYLNISFQLHQTQMDGSHAGRFLENLQKEINSV